MSKPAWQRRSRPRPSSQSILKQVDAIRRAREDAPLKAVQLQLARLLEDVNAWDAVEKSRAHFSRNLCHGPRLVEGLRPFVRVGIVIWHRPVGYFAYRTLTLTGVWITQKDALNTLIVGNRYLPYQAPFYEPEAYMKLMRRNFDVYYADDGLPPTTEGRFLSQPYDPEQRLALRQWVEESLLAICQSP